MEFEDFGPNQNKKDNSVFKILEEFKHIPSIRKLDEHIILNQESLQSEYEMYKLYQNELKPKKHKN